MENNPIVQSDTVKRGVILVLFFLAIFLLGSALNEFKNYKGGPSNLSTITVTGEGEVLAVPDIATFGFMIMEEGSTVPEAQKKATEKNNAVVKMLKEQGIEEKDIISTPSVYPKYESKPCTGWSCPQSSEIVGYQANYSITVKVRKADNAGTITAKLAEIGVQNLGQVTYTIDNDEELKLEARTKAIEDAKKKAKRLAKDLKVDLDEIVSFSENGRGYGAEYLMKADMAMNESSAVSLPAPELPRGENKVISTVSITFKIN